MARRASRGSNPAPLIIIGILVIAGFAFAVTVLGKSKAPYSDLPALPVRDAIANGNSLRGNTYSVSGKVEERWVRNNYEGLHLREDSSDSSIFIRIPNALERPNLERERHYSFSVTVTAGGIIEATGVERL